MTEDAGELLTVAGLLDAGDLGSAVRRLRAVADRAPLPEVAALAGRAASAAGFTDLVLAAGAVVAEPGSAQALYDLGYACVERGLAAIAVPALRAALAAAPGSRTVLVELVAAFEDEYRYGDAVAVLEANIDVLEDWPDRYLLALNSLMAGDIERARRYAAELDEAPVAAPHELSTPDERWVSARQRIDAMLRRVDAVAGPLGRQSLRGWHFVLNGSLLGSVSPYGYDEGMNGRFAYLQDNLDGCRRTLTRLGSALRQAGCAPSTVSTLPDRSSEILGLAAATALGLPARPWRAGRADTVVVAYDLRDVDDEVLSQLCVRTAGTVLVEHATCWTAPPLLAADFTGLLHQTVVPPWAERLMAPPGREPYRAPADKRPAEDVAAEIAGSLGSLNSGGSGGGEVSQAGEIAPDDSDEDFAAFVAGLGPAWPLRGDRRDRVWSPGPVSSAFFR